VSRGLGKNKILGVWVSEEDYPKLQEFLDKFSAGDSFSDQLRNFIHWLVSQTEGIDQTKLALKLKETEEEQKKAEFQCLRARSRALC
jgi:hypothetical protein